ncbi:hypothetical protein CMI37_30090 [Candidatus Pacearchaeota archaeon]|nr:hypothetical protein [Candidatus Pacearchaeota archaeon]|tara:strand:- start:12707 stop:13951 length:1245 start_codon:yes stop_codon:yes gene_type:complete
MSEGQLKREVFYLPGGRSGAFVNHKLIAGKSGSGKSNAGEFIVRQEVGKKKVIDLYDSGRFENMCYGLVEKNPYLVYKLKEITNNKIKPSAVPNEIIMVSGKGLEYNNKFPEKVDIKSFSESDLDITDLWYLIGKTDASRGFLAQIEYQLGKDEEEITFDKIFDALSKGRIKVHGATNMSLMRDIKKWKVSGMFSKGVDKINFEDILKDKNTLTSFSTFLLETDQEPVAYAMILKNILEAKKRRLIKHRIVLYIREVSNFMRSGKGFEEWALCRRYILMIIREGRDLGIDIICDTQRPLDLPTMFRNQFGYYIAMKMNFGDAEKMLEVQEIPRNIIGKVPHYGLGQALLATGMRWDAPVHFPPCPHRHKNPRMDVMKCLGKTKDWDTSDILKIEVNLEEEPKEVEDGKTMSHFT